MIYKQFAFARDYRGYSQTELAKAISGLSQSNLSKFEKGLGGLSQELQQKILEFLEFPADFVTKRISANIETANYRKRATIAKSEVNKFEQRCLLVGYIIDEFSDCIEWPEFSLRAFNVDDGFEAAYVAEHTRKQLGIRKQEPVLNIVGTLEARGIIVYELSAIDQFDGLSFVTDRGTPMIFVNKSMSNDRKRFTIAHELGHLLMHNESNFPISSFRNKEAEANSFASEFLMPASEIKNSLMRLRMSDLANLKSLWLCSMSAIIRRAKDLQCITEDRYKYFMIEMSRSGYGKREPIDVFIDKPSCLPNAIRLIKENLFYTEHELQQLLALPSDIIDELLSFDQLVKLRILKANARTELPGTGTEDYDR